MVIGTLKRSYFALLLKQGQELVIRQDQQKNSNNRSKILALMK